MHFSRMVDMAKSPEDVKADIAKYSAPVASEAGTTPVYPYGLCLSLSEDELAKLDIDGDLPDVGNTIQLAAIAKVTSASQREEKNAAGQTVICKRIELQITHLATEDDGQPVRTSEDRQKKRYAEETDSDD